jgi:hypothetical protein
MSAKMAAQRRIVDGKNPFYIIEPAIDIGCGGNNISSLYGISAYGYDRCIDTNMDATHLSEIEDNSYSLVHSSHCLEHIHDYKTALKNWVRVSNKYILITIPDETMYERGHWPSIYSPEHVVSFSMEDPQLPNGVNINDVLAEVSDLVEVKWVKKIDDGYNPDVDVDQTALGECECVIEILLEKKPVNSNA